jgi:hypothetical protein
MSAVDYKIAWHYTEIAVLKAKRNEMAPIFSLPTELLYAVDSDALFNLKWTGIMYVCRHWRALALAAHALWACISAPTLSRDLRRVLSQLKLSGVAPL